jgi:hypothetical protein
MACVQVEAFEVNTTVTELPVMHWERPISHVAQCRTLKVLPERKPNDDSGIKTLQFEKTEL